MKKKMRMLILFLIIAAVLGVVVLVLLRTDPKKGSADPHRKETEQEQDKEKPQGEERPNEDETAAESSDLLLGPGERGIASLEMSYPRNEKDSFVIVRRGDAQKSETQKPDTQVQEEHQPETQQPDMQQEHPAYIVEGLEKYDVPETWPEALVGVFASLTAKRDLGSTEDPREYGLESPRLDVGISCDDGTKMLFHIGNFAPGGGLYLQTSGNDHVYIIPLDEGIFLKKTDLINPEVLRIVPDPASNLAQNIYDSITIENEQLDKPVQLKASLDAASAFVYEIVSPIEATGNNYTIDQITAVLDQIMALRVIAIAPSDEELARYGLLEPSSRISFTANQTESHTLAAGADISFPNGADAGASQSDRADAGDFNTGSIDAGAVNGTCLMVDDRPVVYLVDSKTVEMWSRATLMDLRSPLILLPAITDVERMTLTLDEKEYVFTLKHDENGGLEVTGSAGTQLAADAFRKFYREVLAVQLYELTEEQPESSAVLLKVTFEYRTGAEPDTVEYISSAENERSVFAVLNNETIGLVRRTALDQIIEDAAGM